MTNISRQQKLAFDPSHGRQAVSVFAQEAVERVRTVSTSRPFVLFVVVAAVVIGCYYFLMAAPIYVSQTSVLIRGREQPSAAGSIIGAITGGDKGGGGGGQDVAELQGYVTSFDMAQKLDQRFHLRAIYSKPRLDFLNWLPPGASRETFLQFYKKMVVIRIDHDANLITIESRAFDPVLAQKMNQAILEIASDYLNNVSDVVRKETLRDSENDLKEAEDDVRKARMAMTNYQVQTGTIDPTASAMGTATGMAGMQQEIVESRVMLSEMLSYDRPDAPEVKQLQARIAGLEGQIAAQQQKIADVKARDSITQRLRDFEGLMISTDYADRKFVAALEAYDAAKGLANQRETFIVPVVPPTLPQDPALPHRMTAFLETLLVLIAVYGIVALAIAGIRDHQGI